MTDSTTLYTAGETGITAGHHIEAGPDGPRLIVTIDLGGLTGGEWQFDSVTGIGQETGTGITLSFVRQGALTPKTGKWLGFEAKVTP